MKVRWAVPAGAWLASLTLPSPPGRREERVNNGVVGAKMVRAVPQSSFGEGITVESSR